MPPERVMSAAVLPASVLTSESLNHHEKPLQATPASAPTAAATTTTREQSPAPGDSKAGVSSFALPPLLCTLVALVAGPLLAVLVFWVLLRRYSVRHGPLFRVEIAAPAAPSIAVAPSAVSPALPAPATEPPPVQATLPRPVVIQVPRQPAQPFKVGPTYADALKQKQDAVRNHEEGLLRHLVEQNLMLREQIGELESAA